MKRTQLNASLTRGFTLIEMLVVIAIIALLAAIIVPSVNGALEASKRTACAAHLRQVGQATTMFAMRNHGFIPAVRDGGSFNAGQTWMETLSPYLGEETTDIRTKDIAAITRACPAWKGRKDVPVAGQPTKPGFGMNAYPLATSSGSGARNTSPNTVALDQILNPSTTILAGDSVDWHIYLNSNNWATASNPYGYSSGHPNRHGKNANYLMADTSVQALTPTQALARLRNPTTAQ